MMPVPIASKVAVVDEDRLGRIDNVFDLAYGVYGAEFMRRDANDLTAGAKVLKDGSHGIVGIVQMVLIANKDKIILAGKHVNDMGNDWLAFNFNEWLRHSVTCTSEALSKSGHRDYYLHKDFLEYVLPITISVMFLVH
jgi:hypothetical protein